MQGLATDFQKIIQRQLSKNIILGILFPLLGTRTVFSEYLRVSS